MFSWGEDSRRGFWFKGGLNIESTAADAGVHHLDLGYHIRDLSAGHNVLAFVKTNGNSFIIRTHQSKDGRRARGKQKFVKCKEKIQAVSCGDDEVTLLSETGTVLCVDAAHTPRPLEALSNIPVCQVACGSQHSVALTKDGQVYTWGQDSRGQLGLGKRKLGASSPQHLRSLSEMPLVQIAAGGEQSFALTVSGGVFSWGRNDCGQLGLGDTTDRHTPTPVLCLNMKKIIHVSCGKEHTATLTKDGAVFTFGSGQHGQLGHNSFSDELRPRLVAELWGAKVIQVACGRHHTLVMTNSKKVYSFGCCAQGQLGHGDETHPSVPLLVQLPEDHDNGPKTRNIFAGGNCSFATYTSNEKAYEELNTDTVDNGTQRCLDDVIDKWTSECDSKSWKKIKQEIHRMLSSASCVNKSFLDRRKDKHFQTSPKYPGLNLSLARCAFKKLIKKDDVLAEAEDAILDLLQSLKTKPVGVEGLRIHLLLNELLHVIQKHKKRHNTKLTEAAAAAVLRLSPESLQVIGDWWSSLSSSTMVKYVEVWKRAITVLLSSNPVPCNSRVTNLLLVLQYMYNANSRVAEHQRIPDNDFCLMLDVEFLCKDLLRWQSKYKRECDEPIILCSFPIVMDLKSKKMVFDMNALHSKVKSAISPVFWNLFGWLAPVFQPSQDLVLDVRQATVLKDTFQQLAAVRHSDYKKPLVVYFNGNRTADDINMFIKDLFHEVFHEMMSAESRMFMFNDSKTLAWFPSNTVLKDQTYFLFGVLCGLALYNQCIIYLPFPLVLFKKLLRVKPSLEDMMEFSPSVGQNLKRILDVYGDDDIDNLYIDFVINWDGRDVDLDPENPKKPVTGQNKKEFVEAYVNYVFNTSVERVFQEFKQGFFLVCDRDLVKLFRPKELQAVLVGEDFHDWATLKENTHYEREYHVGHPTIHMFWEVFDELSEQQKKTFLWFVTGFERVPILGLKNITMTIRDSQIEDRLYDQYLPETHTCSSLLELPLYSTKEIMQASLIEALSKNNRINQ